MILRRLLTITILLTSTIWSQAQQINPVPDYVFRNQMSVGRNAVTDTAAYFSIGPRYGATKGFMPPLVVDTATFSSGKRNGLLIFSVQKNKFLYWDSVRVQWSDMAGSSGSYIKGNGTIKYIPKFSDSVTLANSLLYDNSINLSIGTTSPDSSALLQMNSTTQGFLPPRMTQAQRLAITTPEIGLIVYQTDSTYGIYLYTSTGWRSLTMR